MKSAHFGVLLIAGAMAFSCEVTDHNDYNVLHNCQLDSQNGAWGGMGLELYHDEERSCPQDVTPGTDVVESGGHVDFPSASYPTVNPGGGNYPYQLIVSAFNAYQACQTVGTEMDREEEYFSFVDLIGGSPNGNGPDGNYDWVAGAWVSFTAGTGIDPNRDCPKFQVIKAIQPSTNGVATMVVNYLQR